MSNTSPPFKGMKLSGRHTKILITRSTVDMEFPYALGHGEEADFVASNVGRCFIAVFIGTYYVIVENGFRVPTYNAMEVN